MIFRTLTHMLRSRGRSALGLHDVGRVAMRVLPTDLDVLQHMNNGVYFSIMDLGRMDLMIRSGLWPKMRARGYYSVMANETATFRKSLHPWQKFDLETKIVGYDAKAAYLEQRFVVDGEIFTSAMTRLRFLKKGGGAVSMQELAELAGVDVSTMSPPEWTAHWNDNITLPPTRGPAPSDWN
ncbi:Acyl-CoA thioesterase FadM [Salinibacterium xinjiangense]|uniref:Acyl-CoA thioesterase FadM n=1 Tax=Salinibacterium xinjiangense TaxID=386302 RepID=A0A2C9A127_9MICO|nr:acyl-CoA thioesterase [Salinibacterium xinjiangense]SOE72653.1 Acyl-CoA thioesterase FadM [Salinibacterium xinjiangense]